MYKKSLAVLVFLSLIAVPAFAEELIHSHIPYTPPSVTMTVRTAYVFDGVMILNATLLFELDGSNYTMNYSEATLSYEVDVLFVPADIGNWTFNVYANKTGYETINKTGEIKVRDPIFVNVRLFEDNNQTAYEDDFAQVIMKGDYSCFPLVTRTSTDAFGETTYYTDCYFHSNYTSGLGQVIVYEEGSYVTEFISGNLVFSNSFAYPTIDRLNYEFTLGTFTVDESPETIDIVMTSCELNPEQCQRFYFSLFLWVIFVVIAGVLAVVAGKYSGSGGVAIAVGAVVLVALILLRLALLGY